jgi:hypothetical protein
MSPTLYRAVGFLAIAAAFMFFGPIAVRAASVSLAGGHFPEAASMLLLGAGLVALGAGARRWRNTAK